MTEQKKQSDAAEPLMEAWIKGAADLWSQMARVWPQPKSAKKKFLHLAAGPGGPGPERLALFGQGHAGSVFLPRRSSGHGQSGQRGHPGA